MLEKRCKTSVVKQRFSEHSFYIALPDHIQFPPLKTLTSQMYVIRQSCSLFLEAAEAVCKHLTTTRIDVLRTRFSYVSYMP